MTFTVWGYEINIITQIMGMIALGLVLWGTLAKSKKIFFLSQTLANAFIVVGFFLISKYVASIGVFIAIFRSLTFFLYEQKGRRVPYALLGLFFVLFIANGIVFWESAFDFLPIMSLCANTIICQVKNERKLKILMLIPCALFLSYDIISLFITKAIMKLVEILGIFLFMFKTRNKKQASDEILNPTPSDNAKTL